MRKRIAKLVREVQAGVSKVSDTDHLELFIRLAELAVILHSIIT